MKNRLRTISLIAIFGAFAAGGAALAWFSDTAAPVTNVFNTSTVEITLHDNMGETTFPTEGITNVNPGDSYDKEVYVTSTGSEETYVRVKLTLSWTPPEGYDGPALDTAAVTLNIDSTNWVLGEGGWYYYKSILTPSSPDTTKLLDGVTFSGPLVNNNYQNAAFSIEVEAEAVQASHEAFVDEWGIAGVDGTNRKVPAAGVEEWTP